MKRLILLLICALYVTTAAQAQISFYGEWCRKGSGEKTIMIFDMKEKKAYVMNEARKTCMVMEEIDKLSTNKLVGYDWEVSHSTSREFLGMEEIDGKECAHYYVKSESIYKDGGKDGAGYHEWIYSPMKVSNYNGCIAHGVCDGQDHRASPRQDGAATGAPLPSARRVSNDCDACRRPAGDDDGEIVRGEHPKSGRDTRCHPKIQ